MQGLTIFVFAIASPASRKTHFLEQLSGSADGNNIHSILTGSHGFSVAFILKGQFEWI